MITQTFRAPIGAGLRSMLVAPAAREGVARGNFGRITVIVPHSAMASQWLKDLPEGSEALTPVQWLRRAKDDPHDLIICDELSRWAMDQIGSTLRRVPCQVWLVNPRFDEPIIIYQWTHQEYIPPGSYTCQVAGVTEGVDGSLVVALGNVQKSS